MARIYTTQGDGGMTQLLSGEKVPKHHPRIEAYGTVDELSSLLGVAASHARSDLQDKLRMVQGRLLVMGAILAHPVMEVPALPAQLCSEDITSLEDWIDTMEKHLPTLTSFVIPGGTASAAYLHLARSVCRRAEHRVSAVGAVEHEQGKLVLQYLNRLSDFLFVAARCVNHRAGEGDLLISPTNSKI